MCRQHTHTYTHTSSVVRYQVGDAPLSSISVQGNVQVGGQLVAVGDVNGTVSLLEVSGGSIYRGIYFDSIM